jgi:hypothetical protein
MSFKLTSLEKPRETIISKCCSVCGKLVRLISDRSSEAAIVILDWLLASYSTRAGASLWSSAAPVAAGGRKQAIRFEREGVWSPRNSGSVP